MTDYELMRHREAVYQREQRRWKMLALFGGGGFFVMLGLFIWERMK